MTQEIVVREDSALALQELETRFAMAVRQRDLLSDYIQKRMKPDKHFYTVADGQKPSLTKEGAELICLPHNLKARYSIISGVDNPPLDDAPYQITIKAELLRGESFEGEGIGSASSMVTRKDGSRVQRQKDPGLRHNATIKMACKSAYIAACLNATAASEFFTQDLEDDQTGDFKKNDNHSDTSEHYCQIHKTKFFMKGKMKAFAHPIGDTGEWCHEHKKEEKQGLGFEPPLDESPIDEASTPQATEAPAKATADQVKEIVELVNLGFDAGAFIKASGWSAKSARELTFDQAVRVIEEAKRK